MKNILYKQTKNYLFRADYDKEGWWVDLPTGSRMKVYFGFLKCTSIDEIVLHNFIFWGVKFTWARLDQESK